MHVWDFATAREIQTIAALGPIDRRMLAIALNADGSLVAIAAGNDPVSVWNVETGAIAWTARACGEARTLVFSPDGQRLLGGCGAEPHIWDAASGREVLILRGGGAVFSAAFSPDGTQIVTGGADADATIWEVATGRPSDWLMDVGETMSVGFSPDGSMILTGSRNGALRLWERSGFPIGTLSDNGRAITSARFSADGRRILSVSDGSVVLWDVASLAVIAAETRLGGNLNAIWDADGAGARISAGPSLVDWRFAPALTMNRSDLIELACETTLVGDLARFTPRERRQAPVLDARHDADACRAPTIWTRLTSYFITQ